MNAVTPTVAVSATARCDLKSLAAASSLMSQVVERRNTIPVLAMAVVSIKAARNSFRP